MIKTENVRAFSCRRFAAEWILWNDVHVSNYPQVVSELAKLTVALSPTVCCFSGAIWHGTRKAGKLTQD